MSDENKTKTILSEVSQRIKNSGSEVTTKLVDTLVDREIDKRVSDLDKGLQKLRSLENDFKKLRPDVKVYGDNNEVLSQGFSAEKNDQRKKLSDKIKKVSSAIEMALEKNDFTKLREVIK